MADLTQLDSAGLKAFNDSDVNGFISDLDAIRKDSPAGVKSLASLIEGKEDKSNTVANSFLTIGMMATDDTMDGQSLTGALKTGAQSLDDVFTSHKTLFSDMHDDLNTVISTLLNTQGSSLTSIDGQKLLDPFSNIDSDMSSGSQNSSSS